MLYCNSVNKWISGIICSTSFGPTQTMYFKSVGRILMKGWFNGDAELSAAFFGQRILHAHNRATGTTTASNPLRGRRPMPKTKQVREDTLLPNSSINLPKIIHPT